MWRESKHHDEAGDGKYDKNKSSCGDASDTNGRFPYFILSNREGRNGATTITYPGMLEQLRKMAGMDFYVIPANIHEVLIVGKTENAPIRYLRES